MENIKYYKLALLSPVGGVFYAIYKDGKYYELLTNKEMIIFDTSYEKLYKDLAENDCELVGMFRQEISEKEVSIFLNFLTEATKEEMLGKIDTTVQFIESYKNSLKLEKKKNL